MCLVTMNNAKNILFKKNVKNFILISKSQFCLSQTYQKDLATCLKPKYHYQLVLTEMICFKILLLRQKSKRIKPKNKKETF